jgi:hypothetical protein
LALPFSMSPLLISTWDDISPAAVVKVEEAENPKEENQPPREPPVEARRARRGLTVVEIVLPVV